RSLQEELGNGWAEGVHPEDRASVMNRFRKAFAARRPFELEYRLRNASGQYPWVIDRGEPIYYADGFRGYIGSGLDVNEHKRAERTARLESLYVRLLVNVSNALHHSTTIRHALQDCVDYIGKAMKWPVGHVRCRDSAIRQPVSFAEAWHFADRQRRLPEMGDLASLFSETAEASVRQKQPLWIPLNNGDTSSSRHPKLNRELGIRAVISIPVFAGARPAGSLEFGLSENERPGKKLLDVLKSIGTELGRLVERKSTQHAFELSHQQNRAFFDNASFG